MLKDGKKMFVIVKEKKKGMCKAYRCKSEHTPKDRFCCRHRHMFNKFKNPIKYTYHLLKSNARKRKIVFDLTIDYFTKFCIDNDYIKKKGRLASDATIDRIEASKGYVPGNIQVLSKSENSKKRWEEYPGVPF